MFKNRKLIAILRGIKKEEAVEAARIIIESGIDWLEVTTNSPNYLESVERMLNTFPEAMIGVGTVTTTNQVKDCHLIGAKFIVSPNCNREVIKETKKHGMISAPGILTPSEAFTALESGADLLKFFPVNWVGYSALKDLRAVLPRDTQVIAVGGVKVSDYYEVLSPKQAGFDGIGIGSDLYKSGESMEQLQQKAKLIISSYDQVVSEL